MEDVVILKKRRRRRIAVDPCLGFYVSQEEYTHERLDDPPSDDRLVFLISSSSLENGNNLSSPKATANINMDTKVDYLTTFTPQKTVPAQSNDSSSALTVESFLQRLSGNSSSRPHKVYGRRSRKTMRSSSKKQSSSPIQTSEHDRHYSPLKVVNKAPFTAITDAKNNTCRPGKSIKSHLRQMRPKTLTRRIARAAKLSHVDSIDLSDTNESKSKIARGLKFVPYQNISESPSIRAHRKKYFVDHRRASPTSSSFHNLPVVPKSNTQTPLRLLTQMPTKSDVKAKLLESAQRNISIPKLPKRTRSSNQSISTPRHGRAPLQFVSLNEHEESKQICYGQFTRNTRRVVEPILAVKCPFTPLVADLEETVDGRFPKKVKFSSPVDELQTVEESEQIESAVVQSSIAKIQSEVLGASLTKKDLPPSDPEFDSSNSIYPAGEAAVSELEEHAAPDKSMRRLSSFFSGFIENAREVMMSQSTDKKQGISASSNIEMQRRKSTRKNARDTTTRRQTSIRDYGNMLKQTLSTDTCSQTLKGSSLTRSFSAVTALAPLVTLKTKYDRETPFSDPARPDKRQLRSLSMIGPNQAVQVSRHDKETPSAMQTSSTIRPASPGPVILAALAPQGVQVILSPLLTPIGQLSNSSYDQITSDDTEFRSSISSLSRRPETAHVSNPSINLFSGLYAA